MDKSKEMSRMQAIIHFFNLDTIEKKKEYQKLTEQDRIELAELLKKEGYIIQAQ